MFRSQPPRRTGCRASTGGAGAGGSPGHRSGVRLHRAGDVSLAAPGVVPTLSGARVRQGIRANVIRYAGVIKRG